MLGLLLLVLGMRSNECLSSPYSLGTTKFGIDVDETRDRGS